MFSLNPREAFTIFRGISKTNDSNTYYVQAVIKDARTNTTIDTVNLTDLGNRQFSKEWTVPADPSGQGFWIVIITTVYTDSGYTTKSTVYGEQFDNYLVFDRKNPWLGGGGGNGGGDVDYKKIGKMIDEAISKIKIPSPQPQKDIDLSELIAYLSLIKSSVENIKIPEQKETDLSPILSEIKNSISSIKFPEQKEPDFTPILKTLITFNNKLESISEKSSITYTEEQLRNVLEFIKEKFDGFEEMVKEHKSFVDKFDETAQEINNFKKGIANFLKEEKIDFGEPKKSRIRGL